MDNNEGKFFISNRRKRISQEKIIDNNYEKPNDNNNNLNNNYNKEIRAFKTNNRIYIKPKHSLVKSFDRESTPLDETQKEVNEIKINEVYNNKKEDKDNTKNEEILVNRNILNNKFINNINNKFNVEQKGNKIIFNNKNINKINDQINNNNNDNSKVFNKNKIKEGWARSKYARKKISNNFTDLNKSNEKEKINITQDISQLEHEKSKVNEILNNNESKISFYKKGIFRKKNINNKNYLKLDKKNQNDSQIEHSQFEIISKNIDTTRDDGKSYEESYDDSQNTIQTFPLNKSLRKFYSRHPRKMKRTKTNRRKLNDKSKKKDKKNSYLKLKKEKSEIIQSLKVLLQKKEQIKKEKEENDKKYSFDICNDLNNNDEVGFNNYKEIDNDKRKKIFVNKIRNEELNKIIINENIRKRKDNNNEDTKKNKDKLNEEFEERKIFVKQNEELTQKGDKNSIRSRYKNKRYKFNTEA